MSSRIQGMSCFVDYPSSSSGEESASYLARSAGEVGTRVKDTGVRQKLPSGQLADTCDSPAFQL